MGSGRRLAATGAAMMAALLGVAGIACGTSGGDSTRADAGTQQDAGGNVPACSRTLNSTCGGDPTGAWDIAGYCGSMVATTSIGNAEACQGLWARADYLQASGTWEYRDDGILHTVLTGEYNVLEKITPECVQALADSGTGPDVCAELEKDFKKTYLRATCTTTAEKGCECSAYQYAEGRERDLPWLIEGDTLYEDDEPVERCITGKVLVRKVVDAAQPESWITSVLVRQ